MGKSVLLSKLVKENSLRTRNEFKTGGSQVPSYANNEKRNSGRGQYPKDQNERKISITGNRHREKSNSSGIVSIMNIYTKPKEAPKNFLEDKNIILQRSENNAISKKYTDTFKLTSKGLERRHRS